MTTISDRIERWLREVAVARSEVTVAVPGGVVIRHSRFPLAHDHNRMLLSSDVDADRAAAAVDDVLGGAGLEHRLIDVQGEALADRVSTGLVALGYTRSDALVMTYEGPKPPVATAPPIAPITELSLAERAAGAAAGWQLEQPDWSPDLSKQLGERIRTITDVVDATFLAVVDGSDVVARADLYLRDGIAQIEEVFTAPEARGKGLASHLLLDGVGRACRAGAEVIFLIVDVDGPVALYRRLGFVEQFAIASFSR